MMKVVEQKHLYLLLCSILFAAAGVATDDLSYDYSAHIECLVEPHKPQYGGGIIVNPEFNHGLKGWSMFGLGKLEERVSEGGNRFIVAHSRNQPYDGFSQKLYMHKMMLYTFSAWIQVSEGNAPVRAVFKTASGFKHAGAVVAESGCWSMLKGGLTVDSSGPAELYFESEITEVEIWVDSVSLQPFTEEQWRSHQNQSIEKIRTSKVRIHAVNPQGGSLAGATVSIKLRKPSFPFGCAITKEILTNGAYQNWFTSRFTVTTFENEMKWYSTEPTQGREDYSVPDAMLQFAKQHGISVRGHNIFWDDPNYQPGWVKSLSPAQLTVALETRIRSIVSRYAGQLIAWDVINENLHFSFFEDKLGRNFSGVLHRRAHQLDSKTIMFMNEFNTIEQSGDGASTPAKYLQKLREIQYYTNRNQATGIGLEGHFKTPSIPYMRASIDTLAATGLPIWLTEVDVESNANQAQQLEQVLREAHSHPAVKGIVMWAAWKPQGCYRMCLTDNNFRNLPTGNVVDKLMGEWSARNLEGATDSAGLYETSLSHGDYDITITHMSINLSSTQSFKVEAATDASEETTLHFQLSA